MRAICRPLSMSRINPSGSTPTAFLRPRMASPNNDSYHELIELPTVGYEDPLAGKRYYDQAGVKILVDSSNNITIKDQNGVTLTILQPRPTAGSSTRLLRVRSRQIRPSG
jgi:hypothetical protein